ncbi:DUF29 domain-containing protein [Aphanothece sacrum]|uniref:DUF29 domain-containing protein n=1 Tax=Aphanothece sacrum FPU1 TaxID=1920663 RepID=A0A401IMS5_APHSA|nr:DUF29 domain-containing protein [Aphanothece sacrum]GBF82570.1 hypothetical protein AsFPU1_4000 [Aphanothece sacrum FPU1]GBF84704.1 hypothetical protein AsFPU3_1758 [Aphanothece sacrum FPU3]
MNSYSSDYYAWTKKQVDLLKLRRFEQVDWDNLIEEIEELGNSRENALESYLERLLEHLLKLSYWESEKTYCTRNWKAEIRNFREQIKKIIRKNPALKNKIEPIWTEIYPVRISVMRELFTIPDRAEISLNNALSDDWFPD